MPPPPHTPPTSQYLFILRGDPALEDFFFNIVDKHKLVIILKDMSKLREKKKIPGRHFEIQDGRHKHK